MCRTRETGWCRSSWWWLSSRHLVAGWGSERSGRGSSCLAWEAICPGQKRLRRSIKATIWFLLPSDGTFRRSSNSLQYFLTRQGRRVILRGGDVAYPPWNSHINWIPDPAPLPSRDHGNLNSSSPSRDHSIKTHGKENLPPQDAPHKLPRKLRPQRRKGKQSGPAANHNSPSRETGS